MDVPQIYAKLNEIFIDVLDVPKIDLQPTTTAKEVEDWDSLTNIRLVVSIEKKFKIKFTNSEIQRWANVGEMVASIQTKLA